MVNQNLIRKYNISLDDILAVPASIWNAFRQESLLQEERILLLEHRNQFLEKRIRVQDVRLSELETRVKLRLTTRYRDHAGRAGRLAQSMERKTGHLWVFLDKKGVSPTNNHAERMLRYVVLWRKRSQGTDSEKGDRWVERMLTLRHTCRLCAISSYEILVDAFSSYFRNADPDLSWI